MIFITSDGIYNIIIFNYLWIWPLRKCNFRINLRRFFVNNSRQSNKSLLTFLPSSSCDPNSITLSTPSESAYVTNPNPLKMTLINCILAHHVFEAAYLECLVVGSLITIASETTPNLEKYSLSPSRRINFKLIGFTNLKNTFCSLPRQPSNKHFSEGK